MNKHAIGVAAVLGAGAWGTALAIHLARNGVKVRLWGHRAEFCQQLIKQRENTRYLPGVAFPDGLNAEADIAQAIKGVDLLLVAVPSHGFRETLERAKQRIAGDTYLLWATKGLEAGSHGLLHNVVEDVFKTPPAYGVLSGPTFAHEVAAGLPAAVTIASSNESMAKAVAQTLHDGSMRAYLQSDVIGVEFGGAVKNVYAIGAGLSDGLGFGANARSALITRGLAEMMRLGIKIGAQAETFMGLSGLGDLVLTCTDNQSRNRRFGLALAKGMNTESARHEIGQVVEGMLTARELCALARHYEVEMPIADQIYGVLYQSVPPDQAVRNLISRDLRPEFDA